MLGAGVTVPFVVRVETGTIDRGIYQNAVLFDPTTEAAPTPLKPPKAWNHRLVAIEGFGCPGGWYTQGAAQGNLANCVGRKVMSVSERHSKEIAREGK